MNTKLARIKLSLVAVAVILLASVQAFSQVAEPKTSLKDTVEYIAKAVNDSGQAVDKTGRYESESSWTAEGNGSKLLLTEHFQSSRSQRDTEYKVDFSKIDYYAIDVTSSNEVTLKSLPKKAITGKVSNWKTDRFGEDKHDSWEDSVTELTVVMASEADARRVRNAMKHAVVVANGGKIPKPTPKAGPKIEEPDPFLK